MKTTILTNHIQPAIQEIRDGGIVAFPTETVYGLGADAFCTPAVEKIFAAKGRPADNPLIVHCADIVQVQSVVREWNEDVQKLADAFWPGPLTLVLPKKENVPDIVTAGLDTVGVRIPDQEQALALIRGAGTPVAAPSANVSGRPSPTKAQHVLHDLAGKVPFIIDGGDTRAGIESTVLDCSSRPFTILRPGSVTKEQLEQVLGEAVAVAAGVLTQTTHQKAASPGMNHKHYAPESYRLILVDGSDAFLEQLYEDYAKRQKRVMIITTEAHHFPGKPTICLGKDASQAAEQLYATLIALEGKTDIVLCPVFPPTEVGLALQNRLLRAAGFDVRKEEKSDV